jgi:ABC-type polysaccharide/polyol phosphate export permease
MSVVLLPMWLLSGAFFPGGESGWLSVVVRLNPLTYGVAGLRRLMDARLVSEAAGLPSLAMCLAVTGLFCVVSVGVSVYLTGRQSSQDAR